MSETTDLQEFLRVGFTDSEATWAIEIVPTKYGHGIAFKIGTTQMIMRPSFARQAVRLLRGQHISVTQMPWWKTLNTATFRTPEVEQFLEGMDQKAKEALKLNSEEKR